MGCQLCEEILAVRVAGEAGQALLDQHVRGLDKGQGMTSVCFEAK